MNRTRIDVASLFGIEARAGFIEAAWTDGPACDRRTGSRFVREVVQRVDARSRRFNSLRGAGRTSSTSRLPKDQHRRHLDLPAAVAVHIAATTTAAPARLDSYMLAGELALDGSIRPIRVAAVLAAAAKRAGIVPIENLGESSIVDGIDIRGAKDLTEAIRFIAGEEELRDPASRLSRATPDGGMHFGEVRGQEHVKRALEIAAAGPLRRRRGGTAARRAATPFPETRCEPRGRRAPTTPPPLVPAAEHLGDAIRFVASDHELPVRKCSRSGLYTVLAAVVAFVLAVMWRGDRRNVAHRRPAGTRSVRSRLCCPSSRGTWSGLSSSCWALGATVQGAFGEDKS